VRGCTTVLPQPSGMRCASCRTARELGNETAENPRGTSTNRIRGSCRLKAGDTKTTRLVVDWHKRAGTVSRTPRKPRNTQTSRRGWKPITRTTRGLVLAAIMMLIASGCRTKHACATGAVQSVLTSYAPGLCLATTIGDVRGSLPAVRFEPYVGYVDSLPTEPRGFSIALLDVGRLSTNHAPSDAAFVQAVRLVADDPAAAEEAKSRLRNAFPQPPSEGCSGSPRTGYDQVLRWSEGDGGVALSIPRARPRGLKGTVQIVFFMGSWVGSRWFESYRDGSCL